MTYTIPDTTLTKVVTTLPHFLAAWMVAATNPWYAALIVASTSASVLYHLNDDAVDGFYLLDHGLALLWGMTDAYLWTPSLLLNLIIVALYPMQQPPTQYLYQQYTQQSPMHSHAEWHLFSVAKSLIVARAVAG